MLSCAPFASDNLTINTKAVTWSPDNESEDGMSYPSKHHDRYQDFSEGHGEEQDEGSKITQVMRKYASQTVILILLVALVMRPVQLAK